MTNTWFGRIFVSQNFFCCRMRKIRRMRTSFVVRWGVGGIDINIISPGVFCSSPILTLLNLTFYLPLIIIFIIIPIIIPIIIFITILIIPISLILFSYSITLLNFIFTFIFIIILSILHNPINITLLIPIFSFNFSIFSKYTSIIPKSISGIY